MPGGRRRLRRAGRLDLRRRADDLPRAARARRGIIERKRHIYLCTNGLLLDEKVFGEIAPNKRLTINVHLDGMRETHDQVCAREGVFDKAIEMIREGGSSATT